MARLLVFSPFFFPEPISTGKANTHLVQALVKHGADVTVICSHPLYPNWIPERSDAAVQDVKILRGGSWMRYSRRVSLRRIALEAWFAAYAFLQAWRLHKQADVVIGIFPPSMFALGIYFLFSKKVRRIAVIHDLQGVLAGQRETAVRRIITRLIHAVELRAFHNQDLCIFFSRDMAREAQKSYGLKESQVAVQYPFVTVESRHIGAEDRNSALHEILPSTQTHVVYSGALGLKQNSEQLVAFLQAAAERFPDVQFHVFSGGPIFEKLRQRFKGQSAPCVQFHPLVEEHDLAELYERSTIQLIPQAARTETGALPSKLPNLLATGVLIFAITSQESEVARLLREAGTGIIVDRWDEALFLERMSLALHIAQTVPASLRLLQAEQTLKQFTVENLVDLIFGVKQSSLERNESGQ